jgi:hypothetical protein
MRRPVTMLALIGLSRQDVKKTHQRHARPAETAFPEICGPLDLSPGRDRYALESTSAAV